MSSMSMVLDHPKARDGDLDGHLWSMLILVVVMKVASFCPSQCSWWRCRSSAFALEDALTKFAHRNHLDI